MTAEERVKHYLSGEADKDTARKLENALLEDNDLLERFIGECELSLEAAPDSLAAPVMRAVSRPPETVVPLPGRKLRAAMCFAGAAAVIVCTVFGPEWLPNTWDRVVDAIKALYM